MRIVPIAVGDPRPHVLAGAASKIAEVLTAQGRTVPGVSGDDFRPYFHVLREANYQGAMSIEGKWTDEQLAPAFKEIAKQAGEV